MNHLTIIATDPADLEAAQKTLLRHLDGRIADAEKMLAELEANRQIAKRAGLNTEGLKRAMARQRKVVRYYTGIRAASKAGYFMVPEMHAQVIAIRTDRARPRQSEQNSAWSHYHRQTARQLPKGEGEYVHPDPVVEMTDITEDEQGRTTRWYTPSEWAEAGIPLVGVKPQVLEATTRAMALKVFDEIGILPSAGCGDPLIIGSIKGPNYRSCHFVIAWWLDLEAI